jgi:hypothetical protein
MTHENKHGFKIKTEKANLTLSLVTDLKRQLMCVSIEHTHATNILTFKHHLSWPLLMFSNIILSLFGNGIS